MKDPIPSIRESYDALAKEYTRHIADELRNKPFDRELLERFAKKVMGRICDLGCGPGHVARYLRDAGADVFGLDLSPGMVEQARSLNPDISFREGNMLSLDLLDDELPGIVAFYAIVNLPKESLDAAFREMHRVLQPGGRLLLAFHIGDETLREEEVWGIRISMQFRLFLTSEIEGKLRAAGFEIEEVVEREPYAPDVEYQSKRAYILANKPA